MLELSSDGAEAERQMKALIFYLTTFGYIDGDFDDSEREFVREYIRKLIDHRVRTAVSDDSKELQAELVGKFTKHFHEEFETIDAQVRDLFTEAVAEGENQGDFVHSKLKLRCFEIFQSFEPSARERLLEAIDELIAADGTVHPAEAKFRGEIAQLLGDDLEVELIEEVESVRRPVRVATAAPIAAPRASHPFLDQLEHHYSASPLRLAEQIARDRALLDEVAETLTKLRTQGSGKLVGHQKVREFRGGDEFLDGHVHVLPIKPGVSYDLTVLGDLHGCYSCLKAAIMQARFFEKVNAWRSDPAHHPVPKLVLLGDYIDRGIYSYQGVLRAVMQLFVRAPEHVYMLRGNHEYYLEHKGRVFGGVKPAEAINSLKPHLPLEVFQHYRETFEQLPNMLLFDKTLFVHGGIPRDTLVKERWSDLSTLNDPDVRFQMMWSDPSSADVIPTKLQDQSARFAFGRLQSLAFLRRIGCHTLVRGHEKVLEGFRRVYDDDEQLLITLFSAGGKDNNDLPADSSYRKVTPMAMTLTVDGSGESEITPWEIEWEAFNDASTNLFFASAPEIEHVVE